MRRPTRLILIALACVSFAVGTTACGDPTGLAGSTTVRSGASTSVPAEIDLSCAGPGVQRPNCGVAPEAAGDRGGVLQYAVWVLLVIGLVVVFTVVFRSARRTESAKKADVGTRDWS